MGKIVVRVYTDENTSKAFGVDDETVGDLSKLMREKLELSEAEGRKWAVVEKKPDGERFPDITEKVQGIVSAWDKEKKKTKGSDTDYQFWWKQKPTENRTIRVYFLDGTFKAVVVNADTTAAQLHEAVVQKIELTKDVNFGLFDQRKKGDRPIPPSENILSIMDDWKRNAKKGDKEEENKFVLRLKTPMQNEDVVEDPVRVHLLYLEVRNAVQQGTLNPSTDDMVLLATLDVQINFGDNNPKVHIEGFLLPKLKELIPKKILGTKKEKEWEKEIYKQHASHKGMRPLFAKLEYLQIVNPSFRASASIVAINKAEQQKRDEEEMMKRGKAQAAKAAAPAAPVAGPAGGPPPPPPAPPAPPKGDEEEDVNAFPSLKELTATTVSARVSSRFDLLSSIEDGVNLKRVGDMNDRSAPKIDTSVKLKKSNRSVLLQEIGKGADLKKSETVDKSAPSIAGAKVKKIDRKGMLEGIEKGDKKLKKTETQDRSAPKFSTKKANRGDVFAEIGQGKKLKKAQTVDKSGAVLDKAVKVKKIDRKGILDGIEKGAKLKRAETRDASAPVIAKEMKVEIGARQNLLASIEQGAHLHHVTDADKIPKGEGVIRRKHPVVASVSRGPKAALGGPPRAPPAPPRHFNAPMPPPPPPPKPVATANRYDILSSIEAGEVRLKKTETVDKSGPKVEGQVKIKKVDRAGLLTEISGEKKLKKAETVDKSGPVTEGVKIKKIDRKGMLDGISKGDAKLKKVETVDKSAPKFKSTKVDRGAIMADLASGEKKLKKTKTVDKSAPVVERVKVKKVDRHGLMRGIEAGIDLKPVDTKDNSGPVIDADVKIKKANDKRGGRGGLLDAIEKGTTLKKVEEDAAK